VESSGLFAECGMAIARMTKRVKFGHILGIPGVRTKIMALAEELLRRKDMENGVIPSFAANRSQVQMDMVLMRPKMDLAVAIVETRRT
jgi:hypothetical protein